MSVLSDYVSTSAQSTIRDDLYALGATELNLLAGVLSEVVEQRRFAPVEVEVGAFSYIDQNGESQVMSSQSLKVGVAYTAPLVFTDASGATGKGPVGVVSTTNPSAISVLLSGDGQSINVTIAAELAAVESVRWHDPAAVIPDVVADVSTGPEPFTATAATLGAFTEGTTT